ncbi:hypothetical protein HID58_013390 [Brassica napus]|uniref:Uncharacterized protein n=1 Tax=Brassica napus TaxID=3708 RepID=A0ABQ8E4B5_BRANA|nr:hypothetical protein HID58_013390 [Brassica napus]
MPLKFQYQFQHFCFYHGVCEEFGNVIINPAVHTLWSLRTQQGSLSHPNVITKQPILASEGRVKHYFGNFVI